MPKEAGSWYQISPSRTDATPPPWHVAYQERLSTGYAGYNPSEEERLKVEATLEARQARIAEREQARAAQQLPAAVATELSKVNPDLDKVTRLMNLLKANPYANKDKIEVLDTLFQRVIDEEAFLTWKDRQSQVTLSPLPSDQPEPMSTADMLREVIDMG